MRGRWLPFALSVAFLALIVRLFQLQIYQGSQYKQRADNNHIRQISIQPPRGIIYDRNLTVLVENSACYSLFLVPFEYGAHPQDMKNIETLVGLSSEEIGTKINVQGRGPFRPIRLVPNVDFPIIAQFEESRQDYPGIFYQTEPVRSYPSRVHLSHALGYLGEISKEETQKSAYSQFEWGDIIGKSGVEKSYNQILWGKRGYRYVEVDVRGQEIGNFSGRRDVDPEPGLNIMLSIDLEMQQLAEKLLEGKRGAVIMMDPAQGDVLVYASAPDFFLESLVNPTPDVWKALFSDSDSPLLNRGIQAQLPPGSTFKVMTALSGLHQGLIDADTEVFCPGYYRIGRRTFHCWEHTGHGTVTLKEAIAKSCNVYFYQLGMDLGIDRWSKDAKRWSFGNITGIDLPEEKQGLLPSRQYMDGRFGKGKWSSAIQANIAVGQGDLLVTPVQMLRMIAAIAQKGVVVQPHLVRAIENRDAKLWERLQPVYDNIKQSRPQNIELIIEGMDQAVNGPGGTAGASRVTGISVCGKTGTAQNPHGDPHAWFIGFAPKRNPKLAVVICVENGGSGGVVAAPIAGQLFRLAKKKGLLL